MLKLSRIVAACGIAVLAAGLSFGATYTVNKIEDTNDGVCDADCSLREAIAVANASSEDDIIDFDTELFGTPQVITLSGTELMITFNGTLTINGPGAHLLAISGNDQSRVLSTNRDVVAVINDLAFEKGNGVGAINSGRAGAIYNVGGTLTLNRCIVRDSNAANGGAMNNAGLTNPTVTGDLTINNCIVTGNSSTGTGGALQNFSTSTIRINNSTFTGNVAGGSAGGGAIGVNGTVYVTNSTFTGNSAAHASGRGGGVQTNGSMFVMTNTTIIGNSSGGMGGGFARTSSNLNNFIRNTIIAGNSGAEESPDAFATASISSMGNNIVGVVGTSTGWVKTDLLNTDPLMSPFGFYGGDNMTFVPLTGSPAINGGQNCVRDLSCDANNPPAAVTEDQRGALRNDSTVDIGAVEIDPVYVAELPPGTVGVPYHETLIADDEGFAVEVLGSTPPGLTVAAGKRQVKATVAPEAAISLTGTPTTPGLSTFSLLITEGEAGPQATVAYKIMIEGTASAFPISGWVLAPNGGGVPNAFVVITDGSGFTARYRTNSFGRFIFHAVPAGGNYDISVSHKEYSYAVTSITPTAPVTGLEILPIE